jgi:hypothetical protein
MKDLTPEMLMTFLIVAAGLIGFVLLIWQLIDRIKAASKPARELAQWRTDTDKRLDASEKQGKIMLKDISALLSHEINGNSVDKLSKAQAEITNYLIDR